MSAPDVHVLLSRATREGRMILVTAVRDVPTETEGRVDGDLGLN